MKVCVIKTSSMGDIIHTLPALTDAQIAIPNLSIDWVVEENFTEIPRWHSAVKQIIPIALRRWRKSPFSVQTKNEWKSYCTLLQANQYDAVIDAQGLFKSAFFATRLANGVKHGYDWKSIREPIASFFYDKKHAISYQQHAVERIRQLFAQALSYPLPKEKGDYGIARHFLSVEAIDPYVIFFHSTTRDEKHWPKQEWRNLIEKLTALFPDIPVLSEENCNIPFEQRQTWQTYWLIDPLDGTQQFIDRTDQFSVLITLVQNHQPALGVIHFPILNITYYAMKGFGAFKQSDKEIKALQPRKIDLTQPLKIAVGATTSQEKVRSILAKNVACEFTVVGSSSLKSGLVAEGAVDCYVRLGKTGEWDTAGAEILLAEINGGIFDPHFQPLTYNQRESLINPNFVMVSDNTQNWASVFQFN